MTFLLFALLIELSSFIVLSSIDNFQLKRIEDSSLRNFGWGEVTPHPYFGFVFTPGINIYENQWFQDSTISKKSFNIGFFGGSVAAQFAHSFSSEQLSKRFKEAIPKLRSKDLKFFNLAQGAHKQPQAFHIFMYYLDNMNLAINIEGWNEILPRSYHFDKQNKNTSRISDALPAFTEFLYNTNAKEVTKIGEFSFLSKIRSFLINSPLHTFKLAGLTLNQWLVKKYSKTINKLSGYNLLESNLEFQKDEILSKVKRWKKYCEAQHLISQSRKVKSYTFIQPNHHVPNSKRHHPKEQRMEHATSYVQDAYLQMEDRAKELRLKGFKVYSLKNIFKNNDDYLYQDLEHLTPKGYTIMLDNILERIKKDF